MYSSAIKKLSYLLQGQVCSTDGSGYWSRCKKDVKISKLELAQVLGDNGNYGELQVFFDKNEWDIHKDGLIYTDRKWIEYLRICFLNSAKLSIAAVKDIEYSEQGMQGEDFVSLDVAATFLSEILHV